MLWEEATAKEFKTWIKKSKGVCVLPIGVLEKHGDHLPLGTDMYTVRAIAEKAAELSSVVVFPYYFLGQIAEARHVAGTLSASHRLIMDALLEMCDEIYRNGFTKILILSGHGGNSSFIKFFAQQFPGLNRPYAVYTRCAYDLTREQLKAIKVRSKENNLGDHAGFSETSLMMHLRPDLVHMERVKIPQSESMERLKSLEDLRVFTGFDWYAKYPYHFAGDPSRASAKQGAFIFDIMLINTESVINAIKADKVSEKLIEEYNILCEN